MAVDDTEKAALESVAGQLDDLASGLSGNRAGELYRLSRLVKSIAAGEDISNTPLTLRDVGRRGVAPSQVQTDPAYSPPQPSAQQPQQMTVQTT